MKRARQNGYLRWITGLITLSFVVSALVGCDEDKQPPTSIPVEQDTGSLDATNVGSDVKSDSGGTGKDVTPGACDGVVCPSGESCIDGDCMAVDGVGFSCEAPRDLGVLTVGAPVQVAGNSDGQTVLLKTGCATKDHSSQSVFKFQVSENTEVHAKFLETTQPVVMELRDGGCVDGSTALFCDGQPKSFLAEAGTDYYLIVEARHDYSTGAFKIELEAASQVCSPAGSFSCAGTQRVQCYAGTEKNSAECGFGCNSGVCAGDTCESAIVVSEAMSVVGDIRAFGNIFNFENQPSCSSDRLTGPKTPGSEVMFRLPGLKVGQKILVDTKGGVGSPAIGVMTSCGVSNGCVAADDTTGKLTWPVDTAGDYFVIIDRRSSGDVQFDYQINILD